MKALVNELHCVASRLQILLVVSRHDELKIEVLACAQLRQIVDQLCEVVAHNHICCPLTGLVPKHLIKCVT